MNQIGGVWSVTLIGPKTLPAGLVEFVTFGELDVTTGDEVDELTGEVDDETDETDDGEVDDDTVEDAETRDDTDDDETDDETDDDGADVLGELLAELQPVTIVSAATAATVRPPDRNRPIMSGHPC